MDIPLNRQFEVEKERNLKYLVLSLVVDLLLPFIHGLVFSWIPWSLRALRTESSLNFRPYFTFLKISDAFNKTYSCSLLKRRLYFQPSLLLVAALHVGLNSFFCVAQTDEINYEPKLYVVSKRLGLISVAQVPAVLLFVLKNNFISAISGLTADKSVFFHKWLGRFMFIAAALHMSLSLQYWIGLKFYIMVQIPPQIFGFIAFSCLGMMNLGSLKFIRNFAFEVFMAQHRIFNFVFLLLLYFHNGRTHFSVLLGVHLLVLDRIVARVLGIIHKRRGPTKGKCEFEILDDSTTRVSIPIKISRANPRRWWWCFVPRYGTWKAGQHVYFNCNKVALLAYHPFTISSLPASGKMVIIIRKKTGFTKNLHEKIEVMGMNKSEENNLGITLVSNEDGESSFGKEKNIQVMATSDNSLQELVAAFEKPAIYEIKAGMNGPFGANYQPLIRFEAVSLFSAGSGSSFTLPVALDLLEEIKTKDEADDYLYRPQNCKVSLNLVFKKKAHLKWYDHIWSEFYPYLESGNLKLNFYFTREDRDTTSTCSSIGSSSKTDDSQNHVKYTIASSEHILFHYSRPDVESIVTATAKELSSKTYFHSMACLTCGPSDFNYTVDAACRKNRWHMGAPSIYYYLETFE